MLQNHVKTMLKPNQNHPYFQGISTIFHLQKGRPKAIFPFREDVQGAVLVRMDHGFQGSQLLRGPHGDLRR